MVKSNLKQTNNFKTELLEKVNRVATGLTNGSITLTDSELNKLLTNLLSVKFSSGIKTGTEYSDLKSDFRKSSRLKVSFIVYNFVKDTIEVISSSDYFERIDDVIIIDVLSHKDLLNVKSWTSSLLFNPERKVVEFRDDDSKNKAVEYLHKRFGRKLQKAVKTFLLENKITSLKYDDCYLPIFPLYIMDFQDVDGTGQPIYRLEDIFTSSFVRYRGEITLESNSPENKYKIFAKSYIEKGVVKTIKSLIEQNRESKQKDTFLRDLSVKLREFKFYLSPEIDSVIAVSSEIISWCPKGKTVYNYQKTFAEGVLACLSDVIRRIHSSILYRQLELKDFDGPEVTRYKSDFVKGIRFFLENISWFDHFGQKTDIRTIPNIFNQFYHYGNDSNILVKQNDFYETYKELLADAVSTVKTTIPIQIPTFYIFEFFQDDNQDILTELEQDFSDDCDVLLELISKSEQVLLTTDLWKGVQEATSEVPKKYLEVLFNKIRSGNYQNLKLKILNNNHIKLLLSGLNPDKVNIQFVDNLE